MNCYLAELGMVPENWRTAKLSAVAQVNPDQLGRRTASDYILEYLDIAAIERPGIIGASRKLTFAEAPSRARRRARSGDILVSTVRPYLRNCARVAEAPPNLVASTGYAVVRPANGVDGRFLYQHILSDSFVEFLKARMTGSNYPAVKGDDVEAYTLSLPPLLEQRKIAAILSSVDDAIEKAQAVIDQVQVVKRGLMQELLTRGLPGRHTRFKQTEIGPIPHDWQLKKLSEVASVQTGLAKNKGNSGPLSVPYLRVANVQDGFLDLAEVKAVGVTADALSRYALRPGDVLFTEGGDADKLGRGTVWSGEIEPCLHQNHVFVARTLGNIRPMFLSLYRGSTGGKSYFLNCSKQTTKLASMNSTQLKNLLLPIPRLEEQDDIVDCLGAFDDRSSQERVYLKELERLKAALMSILLTGELRVSPSPRSST